MSLQVATEIIARYENLFVVLNKSMIYNNTVYDLSVAVLFVLLVTRSTQVLTSEIEIRVQNLILIAR